MRGDAQVGKYRPSIEKLPLVMVNTAVVLTMLLLLLQLKSLNKLPQGETGKDRNGRKR